MAEGLGKAGAHGRGIAHPRWTMRMDLLVLGQPERNAEVAVRLARPEDPRAFTVQPPRRDQVLDSATADEARIELYQRRGPEGPGVRILAQVCLDDFRPGLCETPGKGGIIPDQPLAELEKVHLPPFFSVVLFLGLCPFW